MRQAPSESWWHKNKMKLRNNADEVFSNLLPLSQHGEACPSCTPVNIASSLFFLSPSSNPSFIPYRQVASPWWPMIWSPSGEASLRATPLLLFLCVNKALQGFLNILNTENERLVICWLKTEPHWINRFFKNESEYQLTYRQNENIDMTRRQWPFLCTSWLSARRVVCLLKTRIWYFLR